VATGKLSATKVAGKLKPGRHSDGAGLYLHVSDTGFRRWIYRFTINGRTSEKGLGSVDNVTLAEARALAAEARKIAKSGVSPVKEAQAIRKALSDKPTFNEIAQQYIDAHKSSWKNPKHSAQWPSSIKNHCQSILDVPIDELTTAQILGVLQPIWTKIPETAGRLRARIETVWDAAQALGHIDENRSNPARLKGRLDKLLPKLQKLSRGHHPAMPYENIPAFMKSLREKESVSSRALEFIILTAARSGEARGAVWSELDLEARVWTIPEERMKAGKEHRVPIYDRAAAIIEELQGFKKSDFIFPGGKKNRPLTDMAFDKLLEGNKDKAGATVTTHGFRSSFRDWVKECTGFQREIAEAALAHSVGDKAERAYSRGDALAKRREIMDAWGDYCLGKAAKGRWKLG
jgi:hypothetical protein